MDRRRLVAGFGTALTVGLAGCSALNEEGNTNGNSPDENETPSNKSEEDDPPSYELDESGPPPEWTNWLEADRLSDIRDLRFTYVDLQMVLEHLPGFRDGIPFDGLESIYGISEEEYDEWILILEDDITIDTIITGEFSKDEFLEHSEQQGILPEEQYSGYEIFRDSDAKDIAVDDGVFLVSNNPISIIDAKEGITPRLADSNTAWETMLGYLGDAPMEQAATGIPFSLDLSIAPERSIRRVTNIQASNADEMNRYQYTNEELATTAFMSDQEELMEQINDKGSVNSTELQENQIVVEGQVPTENYSP